MDLLENQDQQPTSKGSKVVYGNDQPPQDSLERFLHGLAMMGPTRQKELDTQWLMQWLCKNVYTFELSEFILVNRHLVAIRCFDREYLQMLVPFFCDENNSKL